MQMHNKPYEGLFITLEGGEGSGKSTVAAKIGEELQKMGYEVVLTREPGGSPLSEHLRTLILTPPQGVTISEKSELFLFLAARVQHLEEGILPELRKKKVVICERFNESTIAYQGQARHLGLSYVEKMCHFACDGVEPDVTLILDLDPALGLQRASKRRGKALDRIEQEDLQFHTEVRQGFLHLADQYPQRIAIVDASLPLDEVVVKSMEAVRPHLFLKPIR